MKNGRMRHRESCVALLTDFGRGSFYAGVMKSVICSAAPGARVVDVTHDITPYAVEEASFILKTVFPFFPQGTVFTAVIDPGVGGTRNNLLFRYSERYVVAPDNGLIYDTDAAFRPQGCWRIDERRIAPYRVHPGVGSTFLGRDVFAPAAGALASGAAPLEIGVPAVAAVQNPGVPAVVIAHSRIEGCGRYIDPFGNVLTGITGDHLAEAFGTDDLAGLTARIGSGTVRGVHGCYTDETPGTLMVVLNSWNLIEVSVNQGRADKALGIKRASEMNIVLDM